MHFMDGHKNIFSKDLDIIDLFRSHVTFVYRYRMY